VILTGTAETVDESDTRESHITDAVGGPDDLLCAHIETLNHFTFTITVQALRPQIYSTHRYNSLALAVPACLLLI